MEYCVQLTALAREPHEACIWILRQREATAGLATFGDAVAIRLAACSLVRRQGKVVSFWVDEQVGIGHGLRLGVFALLGPQELVRELTWKITFSDK